MGGYIFASPLERKKRRGSEEIIFLFVKIHTFPDALEVNKA